MQGKKSNLHIQGVIRMQNMIKFLAESTYGIGAGGWLMGEMGDFLVWWMGMVMGVFLGGG